jgi:hypothetical protein
MLLLSLDLMISSLQKSLKEDMGNLHCGSVGIISKPDSHVSLHFKSCLFPLVTMALIVFRNLFYFYDRSDCFMVY